LGKARKPKANDDPVNSLAARPRNRKAAGKVIRPPMQTSKNSFMLHDVNPLSAKSSFFVR